MTALQPITVVELRQPRCSRRFAVYPCVAAIATGTTRTNLALRSEEADNATWTKVGTTVTANSAACPDGAVTADSLIETTATSAHYLQQSITLASGSIYTFSVFAKIASGTRQITLRATTSSFATTQTARFNGSTGALVSSAGGVTAVAQDIGGGWWRFAMTTVATTGTAGIWRINLSDGSAAVPSYTGNGTSGYFIWGAQVELGSGASTYKPTTTAAVTATWGTASAACYNTWGTCPSAATRARYSSTGQIRWRFMPSIAGVRFDGDFTDADDPAIPAIPVPGLTVRTSPASLNPGGLMEGKSPFGVTGTVQVTMQDFVWSDTWGDFNTSLRSSLPTRTFWSTWVARNRLFAGMELVIYDGYVGEALSAMRQRVYLVDGVDGPVNGSVTIRGSDPLKKARGNTALFPPAAAMTLRDALTATATSITLVADAETSVSQVIGLTSKRVIRVGDELIGYSGYSTVSAGIYTLTGVQRGIGGTAATTASAGSKVTRVGHFENVTHVDAALHLLTDWTTVPDAYIDSAGFESERDDYLSVGRIRDVYVSESRPVEDLLGELCQQGAFVIWWDEWSSLIRLKAVVPPDTGIATLTDDNAILADSAELTMEPDSRVTRIVTYYGPQDWTKTTKANCLNVSALVDGDGEAEAAGGEARPLEIVARWIGAESQAFQMMSRMQLRVKAVPRFLRLRLDAKDREVITGDIVDVVSRAVVDSEGRALTSRWQVISATPAKPGQEYEITLQDYALSGARYAWIMDNAAPDYTAASAAGKARGAFIADSLGVMSDGLDGYRLQ